MAFILFIFFVAAAISSVAAYFSLVGLGSIFTATFWGVVIMGGALEVGKIVTTKWVHANWKSPEAPWYFRGLLCFFVACLMAITSLGIYGYLSKGHLEQQAPLAGLGIQVAQLEQQVKQKQDENTRLEARLAQIGKITDKVLEGNGRAGLRASQQQKKESATIQASMDANNQTINDLTTKLVPLKVQTGNVQGELGVAKFIAEALGWAPEKAIRLIISLIMATFDPLALAMFIMGSISLERYREAKRRERLGIPGDVLPTKELIVPMPPVADPLVVSEEPAPFATVADDIKDQLEQQMIADMQAEIEAERASRQEALDDADAAFEAERADFEAQMAEIQQALFDETETLEGRRAQIAADNEELLQAHQQLLDMEARLDDERQLLQEWETSLTGQQQAINNWKPDLDYEGKAPKDKIIEMLEANPDIINDIIQMVDAMRPKSRPGLG